MISQYNHVVENMVVGMCSKEMWDWWTTCLTHERTFFLEVDNGSSVPLKIKTELVYSPDLAALKQSYRKIT